MNRSYLRMITYASLAALAILLKFYSKLNDNVIVSIVLIMLFLVLFTFIFKRKGSARVKLFIMVFSLIVLPLFVFSYIGELGNFSNPLIGMAIFSIVLCGIISIIAIFRLDYAELKWE